MKHFPLIPITNRQRYMDSMVRGKVLRDSRGAQHATWPGTLDIPTGLIVWYHDDGLIEEIECRYLKPLGDVITHTILNGEGVFDLFETGGLLCRFGVRPRLTLAHDTYDQFLRILEGMYECVKFLPDTSTYKWKTIFSIQLVLEQWAEGKESLTSLLTSTPYR